VCERSPQCVGANAIGDDDDDGHVESDACIELLTIGRGSFTQGAIPHVTKQQATCWRMHPRVR
jgi:hypothetical protein